MAVYKVRGPDGVVHQISGPDDATDEQIIAYAQEQFGNKPVLNPAGEAGAALATGTVAAPLSGLAGLAGAALPGPGGQGADWAEKVRQALTYQPRSKMGAEVLNLATSIPRKIGELTDKAGGAVTDATGSPLLGTAVKTGLDFLPQIAASGLKVPVSSWKAGSQAAADAANLLKQVKNETLQRALDEGYVVPPSAIRGNFITNRMESIGGKAAVGQEAASRNQAVTDKIARREAGIPADQPISESTLEAARDAMSQPYRDVAALSPIAKNNLERLKQSRADANRNWGAFNQTGDPKFLAAAKNFDRLSNQYENAIDLQAKLLGKPDLLNQLRQARQDIAKNSDVARAWNPGSGEVDAVAIGRALDQGKKLSGGLETIGRFALAFRPYAREGSRIPTPGVSKSEALASAALGVTGNAAGLGFWPALAPLVSHPMRSAVLSETMRPSVGLKIPAYVQAADAGTQLPYYLMPGLGLIPPAYSQ